MPGDATLVPVVDAAGKRSTFVELQWTNHGGEPDYKCAARSEPLIALEIALGSEWVRLPFVVSPVTVCVDPMESVFLTVAAP